MKASKRLIWQFRKETAASKFYFNSGISMIDDDIDDVILLQYRLYLERSSKAITPDLSTEELGNSLSIGDEHLDTIPETELDEVIKSSVEDLVPIPSESEGIFSMCDVPSCDKKHFDVESDLRESLLNHDTSIIFSDHTEETRSGSTTYHADISFPEYDSFHFEIEPNLGDLISSVMDNFFKRNEDNYFDPEGGEIDTSPNVDDDHYFPFTFVIRIFLPYLTYPKDSSLLLSCGNEDTIFDPSIFAYIVDSYKLVLFFIFGVELFYAHVYLKHLNESLMEICSSTCFPMDQ
ncbi:hypothetical protein Tco_0499563 [Tanacetum coccineum]